MVDTSIIALNAAAYLPSLSSNLLANDAFDTHNIVLNNNGVNSANARSASEIPLAKNITAVNYRSNDSSRSEIIRCLLHLSLAMK